MPSFILDLDKLVTSESPELDEIITPVRVESGFISELKGTFESLDSEDRLTAEFPLSEICSQSWAESGDSELIKELIKSLAEDLHPIQKSDKGILFHSTESEVLVAHFHMNEGWVYDSGALINGDRVDKDSVISMFVLESRIDYPDDSEVRSEYYTESTTFMDIFGVLSDDVLQEIPDMEVYLNGDPIYDERYSVRYSFERDQFTEMIDDGSFSLDSDSGTFSVEKQRDIEPRPFKYGFEGGQFGLTRTEDISRFQREYIQYKHGWLTSKRIYQHLVSDEGPYQEFNTWVNLSNSTIQKCEAPIDRGHVIFAKHDDEGVITQEFADTIVRAIAGKEQYRLYFASHQPIPEHEVLQFNSGSHTFSFSNISQDSAEDEANKLEVLYDQAVDESLPRARRYMSAVGLLSGIHEVSSNAAANSLEGVTSQSSYGTVKSFVEQELEASRSPEAFRASLNSFFEVVGTETQSATLVGDGFEYDSFHRFVEMIDQAGQSLELSAGDFSELNEEGYRSVITTAVGQRIDGNLTREAETGRGPSDIRLRGNDGNVVYIGECKYWRDGNSGAELNVKKPLEQLDTYDQHQIFNSIIIFFKSDDFPTLNFDMVWERAEEKLQDHDGSYTQKDEFSETPRSRIYKHQPSEGGDERFLSLHVFDVGVEQHHESGPADEELPA